MKFSTDVLLIAPAVMGAIFSISRIWDAISDPIAGYLSDRTTFKFGRRRTWMLISFVPIAFGFLAVFSPPENLQGQSLDLWMMIAILSFYSAITLFNVPHMALGAELSEDYHERTRLFGVRHIGFTLGSILSLVSMSLLISEESSPTGDVRELAGNLALFAVLAMTLMIFFSVSRLKENPEFQNRVNKNPFKAFRDIWVNPHARILIIVLFIENLGGAVIGVLTLYVTQYIVEAPAWAPLIIFAYMLPSALSVPLWIPLSRKFGKIRLWVFSLALTGVSFGGIFIIPFLDSVSERLIVMFLGAALGGMFTTMITYTFFPTQGFGYLLLALAAVFVGGTPYWGGLGTIIGAVFGVGVIAYMEVGIIAIGWSGEWRQFFNGLIILLALLGHRLHGERVR